MNNKCLVLAIISSVLTVAYYAWMISAWINLDGRNSRQLDYSDMSEEELEKQIAALEAEIGDISPPTYAYYIKRPIYRCDSILKVNTSRDASYVIKVVDPCDGEVIMIRYLPAGTSHEIDIPSGTFEIRYTSGTEWFGDDEMFGARGSYAKADRLFNFSEGSGYELTLYRVPNGNLHTSRMKKEDF